MASRRKPHLTTGVPFRRELIGCHAMMRDRDDAQSIRQDLQRWRDMLKRDVDDDARRALRELIHGAEKRLKELEEPHKVT